MANFEATDTLDNYVLAMGVIRMALKTITTNFNA